MNSLPLAKLTFREAVRRKALYGAIGMTIVFLALYGWGIDVAMREMAVDTGTNGIQRQAAAVGIDTTILAVRQLFVAGLFAVSNIAGLLAIFMAAGNIAQEVDQGTLYAIVSKPAARLSKSKPENAASWCASRMRRQELWKSGPSLPIPFSSVW